MIIQKQYRGYTTQYVRYYVGYRPRPIRGRAPPIETNSTQWAIVRAAMTSLSPAPSCTPWSTPQCRWLLLPGPNGRAPWAVRCPVVSPASGTLMPEPIIPGIAHPVNRCSAGAAVPPSCRPKKDVPWASGVGSTVPLYWGQPNWRLWHDRRLVGQQLRQLLRVLTGDHASVGAETLDPMRISGISRCLCMAVLADSVADPRCRSALILSRSNSTISTNSPPADFSR